MPQDNMLAVQASEPFLATLFDETVASNQNFVKPRDKPGYSLPVPSPVKNSYLPVPSPVYQSMPVYIPPPDYGIPVPVSPTPSPSPYSNQENDPLYRPYGLKKYPNIPNQAFIKSSHSQLVQQQEVMPDYSMFDNQAKQKDLVMELDERLLAESAGYSMDMLDPSLSTVDYMQAGEGAVPYRVPGEFYTLNDIQCSGGVCMPGEEGLYQQQIPATLYQTYENYAQYPRFQDGMMPSEKKISPIEQAYQQTWAQQGEVGLQINSPYTLSGKEDINLAAAFSLSEDVEKQDFMGGRKGRGFPQMELHTETSIPNLRGRKNSSFREYQSTSDTSPKDTQLPPDLAQQIEQQFAGHAHIEVLNEGGGGEQEGPEYHNLTPLTAGPQLIPQQQHQPETDTLDKVRSVFMSFVDRSDENINKMDDTAKTQMFMNVCNMYKSLSVINIAGNLQQGKAGKTQVEEAQVEQQGFEQQNQGKRYKLRRTRAQSKIEKAELSPTDQGQAPRRQQHCTRVVNSEELTDDKCRSNNTCDFCGKTFPSNSSLKVHMNLHTGEKPHICEFCKRGFGDPSNLKRHLRIHTRSRPYTCHMCPTSFNQSSHLVRHIRSHSQRGCHKSCRFCLATFPHYSNLRRHTEKCPERKRRGDVPLLPMDEDDKDEQYYEEQYAAQQHEEAAAQYVAHEEAAAQYAQQGYYMDHREPGKHDMNYVLGGQGIENEPFIDLSPINMPQCDETYMRLLSMKQERSKMMTEQQMFGMKPCPGDGSNISV